MKVWTLMSGAFMALALVAGPAYAEGVAVKPLVLAPAMQEKFAETYGEREIAILEDDISRALTRELAKSGYAVAAGGPISVEVTLIDATPNRPTFQQATDKVGLDIGRSFGIGGASLEARVVNSSGVTVSTVKHRYYETDIEWAQTASTWTDARRAIHRFAHKVADAVEAQSAG